MIWASREGTSFRIHVQPRASQDEIVGRFGEAIKVRLTAPPVEGAANKALVELLAECLGIPKGQIQIVRGQRARKKVVTAADVSPAQVRRALLGE
jgi:hypothetical protein